MIKKSDKRKQQEAEGKHGDTRHYFDRATLSIKYVAFYWFSKEEWYLCRVGSTNSVYMNDADFTAEFILADKVTFPTDPWEAAARQGTDDET